MSLKMGSPSLDNEAPKITPQQERSLALENNTANLESLNTKVNDAIKNNSALNQFPETAKELIQNALVRECYLKCGENPNITDIKINHNLKTDETKIELKTFNSEVSIDADKVLNESKFNNDPALNLDSLKSNIRLQGLTNEVEKENAKFEGNRDVLSGAFDKAVEYRSNFIDEREAEIKNAGVTNRILGKAPERIPSIAEVPITKDEILRHVPLGLKTDESFLKLLDSSMEQNHHFSDRNMGRDFLNDLKNNEVIPPNVLKDYLQHEPNADVEGLKSKLSEHIQQINEINTFNKEKEALSEAFKGANNERLMAVVERNKEIAETSGIKKMFGFGPEKIPTISEQGLSKEEILKHVDPKIAESETFQVMLNGMVERLEKSATGEIGVDFWDTIGASIADTAGKTWDAIDSTFANVNNRIVMGDNANSNYAALGLTDTQIDRYIQERIEAGESIAWISAKLAGKSVLYNAWNLVTWGALKENDMLAVRHADGEISESEMKNAQYLNGGIALAYTVSSGVGAYSKALVPISNASIKMHAIGGGVGFGVNIGMQYAINDEIDWKSAMTSGVVGTLLPAYGYKGLIGVSSIGTYVDNKIIHDKSLLETGVATGVNAVANTFGYGMSYALINNKYVIPKLSQSYRYDLYSNGGHNYIHNYTTFKNSEVLAKAVVRADVIGSISVEAINQLYSKDKKNEK